MSGLFAEGRSGDRYGDAGRWKTRMGGDMDG